MARALILIAALTLATPAFAGQLVSLKAEVTDADGLVTLSDLFDGAGAAGRMAVARRTGPTLALDAGAVRLAAARAGLSWDNPEGLKRIVVVEGADSAPGQGRSAAAKGNVQVLTYARNLSAGEIVGPADIVWGKAAAAPYDAPSDPDALIGQAARRPLRAGAVATGRDVVAPVVVRAGEVITVSYEDNGVSLSLQAKATAAAGVGETLNVQNTSSLKIFQAVVAGPGQAVVGPAAEQMRTLRPARYAQR